MTARPLRGEGPTMITSNSKQPYAFIVTMESNKTKIKIQAKHTSTKNAYSAEFTHLALKKIGYFQNLKGFYTRLNMALQSKAPKELVAYYYIQTYTPKTPTRNSNNLLSSAMANKQKLVLTLEESSKYDDDTLKYNLVLPQLHITDTVKLNEKLGDVATEVDKKYMKTQRTLDAIVQQVKQKFSTEQHERAKLAKKVSDLESLCKKLTKKCLQLQEQIDNGPTNKRESHNTNTNEDEMSGSGSALNISQKLTNCDTRITDVEQHFGNEISILNKKFDDVRPKLVRLKSRKDFASEQGFIEYITKKLEQWDTTKFGPILVRVQSNATGKAKHFVGYVGEPQKWNHTICKVQWFGLGKKLPQSVEWKALDVFLPLSAFYYPDCPHARASAAITNSNSNSNKSKSREML